MKRKSLCTEDVCRIGLLFLLLFLKCFLIFYPPLHLADYDAAFSLFTASVPLLAFALLSFFSVKTARGVSGFLYAAVSVLMAVDAVYCSYTSKLPSVTQAGMAWQIGDVTETVMNLIRVKHVLLILDLTVWLNLAIHRRDMIRSAEKHRVGAAVLRFLERDLPKTRTAAVLAGCAAVCMASVFLFRGFRPEYLENEIYAYHAADILDSAFSRGIEDRKVDKSEYASPDWSGSEYYGLAAGRNVIVIQVEALQNFVIGAYYEGQEVMPTLDRLIAEDSLYFDHYYYQIGGANTADAEFAVNNSLFAPEENGAYVRYPVNRYYSLPMLLKDNGYGTAQAFHGYIGSFWNRETAYPYQGFDDYTSLEDLEETDMFPLGLSDKEFFRQTTDILGTLPEPFYAFCITASSHFPYGIPLKDRDILLKPEDEQTLFGLYLQAINYADRAIGEFLEELKEAGLYDNSVILIYGDHYALSNTDAIVARQVRTMIGRNYTIFDVFNVPFIVHIPGGGRTETLSVAGGHMDVMPTLLCLIGLSNEKAVMFGQNLLEAQSGFVCEQAHVSVGSFISDDVFFQKPHNNIRSNYRVYDRKTMASLNPDDYESLSREAEKRIRDCEALLARDDVFLDS